MVSLNMAKKYFISSEKREYLDRETGEYQSVENKKLINIKVDESEEFYMVFFKYMSAVWELNHATDIKLIFKLCEVAKWQTGTVSVSPGLRDKMCKDIKLHTSNFSKSIKRLTEKGLISGDRGEYLINPMVFWKGNKASRNEIMESEGMTIAFNFSFSGVLK